jgi:toxin ParE1/3/4
VRVRYSNKALTQLDDILSHIGAHSPSGAKRVQMRIKLSIDRLTDFPYSGRETDRPGIRLLSVTNYPYLIFYTVDAAAEEVQVLRIRHGARDPARHFD